MNPSVALKAAPWVIAAIVAGALLWLVQDWRGQSAEIERLEGEIERQSQDIALARRIRAADQHAIRLADERAASANKYLRRLKDEVADAATHDDCPVAEPVRAALRGLREQANRDRTEGAGTARDAARVRDGADSTDPADAAGSGSVHR